MHTLVRAAFLRVGIQTSDLEAFRNILGYKRTIGVSLCEDIFFHAILVDELDVIDVGSTVTRIDSGADLLDRLVFDVVSNESIASVATIEELSLNAAFEDKLKAAERAISLASFDLLELQRPHLILAVQADELFSGAPSECFFFILIFGDVSEKLQVFHLNPTFFVVV